MATRLRQRHAAGGKLQRPGDGDGHQCDQRQVDAAADHDQSHRHAEDAEDGDAADQIEELLVGQEAGQRDGEADAQQHRQTEDDLFLAQAPEDLHAGLSADARATREVEVGGEVIGNGRRDSCSSMQPFCLSVHSRGACRLLARRGY